MQSFMHLKNFFKHLKKPRVEKYDISFQSLPKMYKLVSYLCCVIYGYNIGNIFSFFTVFHAVRYSLDLFNI